MKELKLSIQKGWLNKKALQNAYYITPSLKIQPYCVDYTRGFELLLWWIKGYVSIRILWRGEVINN